MKIAIAEAIAEEKLQNEGETTWTHNLSKSLCDIAESENDGALDAILKTFNWNGKMFEKPPDLKKLLLKIDASWLREKTFASAKAAVETAINKEKARAQKLSQSLHKLSQSALAQNDETLD